MKVRDNNRDCFKYLKSKYKGIPRTIKEDVKNKQPKLGNETEREK